MKTVKHLSVLLAVLLVVSIAVVGFVVSADDPAVITVTNEEEFAAAMVEANATATIELANDITLTNGNTTVPGTFKGTFDGKGFTLSGITNTLFNKLSGATVKDVVVEGAITSDNRKAATIAYDEENNSFIKNVTSYVDITMSASDLNAGGIIGYGKSVTFENVTYAGDYVATWNGAGAGIGGIIGYTNNNGTANYINCAFTGTMTVNGTATGTLDLGAIIGIARNGENNFENCVNGGTFTVTAPATTFNVSAVVGRNRDNSATISVKNCLNYGTASEGITVAGVVASGEVATNEGNVTAIPVANADELSATLVDANINAYIILTADIDMTGKEWAPIKVFKGTFDGNGHVISGIHIEQAFESDGYGYGLLIRDLEQGGTGTVKNLTLKDCSLKMTAEQTGNRNNHIGGVVGWSMKARFENIKLENVDVSFTGSAKGEVNIGGLIGCADSNNATTGAISFYNCSSDKDCSVEGVTTGRAPNVAGLVGRLKGNGQKLDMKDCVNNASVTSNDWAGGLVACIDDKVNGGNAITNCANYGTIKTTGEAAAALVGSAGNAPLTVKDSVAGGFVLSTNKAGAVCGVNNNAVTVENTKESAIFVAEDGTYMIGSGDALAFALANMAADTNITLTADVTLPEGTPTAMIDYAGTLDGAGYTISGLSNPMFKKIVGGTVKNVTFEGNVDFTDESVDNKTIRRYATTIALEAKNVTLENVTSNVNITVIGTDLNAGGLIGYANEATLTNCTYGGTYTATGDGAVGAMIGYVRTNSGTNTYTNCSFTGTINFDGVEEGKTVYIGGLVGKHRQHTVNVVDASVTGTINVTNNAGNVYVGGFMGTDNDVATLTMSGVFDGTINADGATVDPFLADDAGSPADLSGCKAKVYFDKGTITLDKDGAFLLGTDSYSAFLSVRDGATEGTQDYRFVIVADGETYKAATDVKLVLTFTKDGAAVKTLTKTFAELELFAKATAAGNTYIANEGCFLTGLVVTGVPADAWDIVTVAVVDGETALAEGEVMAKDITETGLEAKKLGAESYDFEDHHTDLNCHASWVLLTDNADVVAGITDGTYTAVVYLDGEAYTIKNTHNADVWLRMDLETAGATIVKGQTYTARLSLLDANGNVAYITDTFTIESKVHSTNTAPTVELPRGLDKYTVDASTIVADGIATWGDGPATNLFDGKLTKEDGTKIGGGITGSFTVSFSLTEAQTVTYYTFTTGGDTAAYGRNPDAWTLYGKVGEEWVALSTVSNETAHNGFLRMNATSFTWKVENPQACKDYKVEFTSDEGSFQMNELELFGGTPVEQISVNSYGFENHHADLDNHVAWVVYLFDGRAKLVEDGTYKVVVNVNGTNYPIEKLSYYVFDSGDGYVRMDLEAAGITGIKRGETYACEVSLYDAATGEYLFYSQVHEVQSNIFSSDIPTQNVDLPAKDIEKVTVDTSKLGYEGINPWNVETEGVGQLFDGNTEGTKLGGGVDGDTLTVTFSLTAPATITYYTLTTGGDTASYADRNPAAWTLYGKVGEEWVALSTVGETLRTGLTASNKTPFTYAVANPKECTEYKIVFTKTGGSFQMNELELYTTVGTFLGSGMYNSWFSNENDGTKAFVVWLADSVGGADTVAKIIAGDYKAELVINGVAYTELTNKGAGRYWVIDLEASGATELKKGEYYDTSFTIRDAEGNRLYYADPMSKECVVEFGEPVRPGTALGSGMYNPNFSLENDGTKALVVWLADSVGGANTVAKIISGDYKAELVINGVTYTELTNKGAGRYWVIDLAATGVTGLKNGESYGFSFIISDADGNCLYYSEDLTRECKFDLVPPMSAAEELEAAKAEAIAVPFNSSYGINANTKEIGITVKMDGGLFPTVNNVWSISSVTAEGAYIFIKDVTNNGEYVKYDVAKYRSDAHYRMYITADGFEPVAGVQYDVWFFFIGGDLMLHPGELHVLNDSNSKLPA